MTKALSIQLKASFLILVFGLNTVVGFACAIGANRGLNKTHHHEEKVVETHVQADGKMHQHGKREHKHSHTPAKEDCCNDQVLKIFQADKGAPPMAKLSSPVFFTSFVASYFAMGIDYSSQVSPSNKYFVRSHHPPIPDIRITIQSFQI